MSSAAPERMPVAVRTGDLERFTALELDVPARQASDGVSKDILVTGATGFLGAFVLRSLLDRTAATVRCLVRAESVEEGRARLVAALDRYGLDSADLGQRMRVVVGDVALSDAGLSRGDYDRLAAELDAVVHVAARVHWLAPFEELAGPNVDGTRRMLELATRDRLKTFHHVSSIGVFPYRPDVPVFEDSDLDHDEPLFGGYVQTKWVAEKLVARAGELGVPVRTYRPGTLVGSSRTGHFSRASFLDRLLIGSVQFGSSPMLARAIEMTPVDYSATALVALLDALVADGAVLHLTNPAPVAAEHLHELIAGLGYRLGREPFESWRDRLLSSPEFEANALRPFRLFLAGVREDQLSPPPYGSERAQAALAGTGVRCPPVDQRLIATYFARYAAEGFLPRPGG